VGRGQVESLTRAQDDTIDRYPAAQTKAFAVAAGIHPPQPRPLEAGDHRGFSARAGKSKSISSLDIDFDGGLGGFSSIHPTGRTRDEHEALLEMVH